MTKRMRSFIIFVVIFSLLSSIHVFGADMKPSSWAEEEVNEAISNDLVHESLRNSYQTPIKRFEYVLLALDVLKLQGVQITLEQEYAFDDIIGHPYEKEILKAYQVGIINGYGNGIFKPNENITREEVAVLVVRLLKRIDSEDKTTITSGVNYSDINLISSWAQESVNYCYANKILKGVGKDNKGLDVINPRGTATREESILLLYRLAKVEEVVTSSTAIITIDPNVTELSSSKTEGETFDLSYFSRQFSEATSDVMLELDSLDDVSLIDITNTNALIVLDDGATIYLSKYEDGISLELHSMIAISDRAKEIYLDLLKTINSNEIVSNSIDEGINDLNQNEIRKTEVIAERYHINIRIDETDAYLVKYYEEF